MESGSKIFFSTNLLTSRSWVLVVAEAVLAIGIQHGQGTLYMDDVKITLVPWIPKNQHSCASAMTKNIPGVEVRKLTGTDSATVIKVARVRVPPETAEMIREMPYQTMMFTPMGMMALKEFAIPSGTASGSLMVQSWSMTNLLMATEHRPTMIATNKPPVPSFHS